MTTIQFIFVETKSALDNGKWLSRFLNNTSAEYDVTDDAQSLYEFRQDQFEHSEDWKLRLRFLASTPWRWWEWNERNPTPPTSFVQRTNADLGLVAKNFLVSFCHEFDKTLKILVSNFWKSRPPGRRWFMSSLPMRKVWVRFPGRSSQQHGLAVPRRWQILRDGFDSRLDPIAFWHM